MLMKCGANNVIQHSEIGYVSVWRISILILWRVIMKNVRILFVVFLLLFVSGCTEDADKLIKKIEFNDLDKEVESYIDQNIIENGIYLINNDDNQYLLLSNRSVTDGDEAGYFSDVHAEFSEGTLNIYFNENFVEDYTDERLEDNMIIYLILDNPGLESILAHKNGFEIPFDTVFGI